jgi:hypothetical protein
MAEISTAQITVTETPTLLVQADTDGCVAILHTHANHGIEIGTSTVTAGTGFGLHDNETFEFRIPPNGALYGIRSNGSNQTVWVMRLGNRS